MAAGGPVQLLAAARGDTLGMMFSADDIRHVLDESAATIGALAPHAARIAEAAASVVACLEAGGTVFTAGNGGSAAEALHLAEELIGKYRAERRALAAVCLNADPTAMTCIANDFGFEQLFARQLDGLARPGDVFVGLSTSGKSPNILRAMEVARARDVVTLGLLGKDGGPALPLCDHAVVVPSDKTERIQEAHQVVIHIVLDAVERWLGV